MEEILASIRRIIAEEEEPAPALRPTLDPAASAGRDVAGGPQLVWGPPRQNARPTLPIFGLSRPAQISGLDPQLSPQVPPRPAPPAPPPAVHEADGEEDHLAQHFEAPHEAAEPAIPEPELVNPAPRRQAAADGGSLVSSETSATVSSAFQALTASVALTSGDLIERHVREMLRPLLKRWLDDNLPTIVEKLVRAEIERVARGGR